MRSYTPLLLATLLPLALPAQTGDVLRERLENKLVAEEGAQARKTLEAALAKNPADEAAWMELAQLSYATEQPEQTLAVLRRAVAALPRPAVFWRFIAQVHLDDAEGGARSFVRPNGVKPRQTTASGDETVFVFASRDAAAKALEKAMQTGEGELKDEAAHMRATVLMAMLRWKEAELFLSELTKRDWDDENVALLALCILEQHRPQEALALAEAAVRRAPDSPDLHAVKARIHTAMGNRKDAAAEEAIFVRLTTELEQEAANKKAPQEAGPKVR